MEQKKKKALRWLCISLVLMLVGLAGANLIQSDWGRVTVKDVEFVESSGLNRKGTLYIPDNATAETPAPAIVLCHGMYADSGIMDANFVEFARRGYVVLACDSPSHGESDNAPSIAEIMPSGYEAVKFVANLPYVDATNIGITGHSLGGSITSTAVAIDAMVGSNLIKSALINSTAPNLVDRESGEYYDAYGAYNVALMAGKTDEFGFRTMDENGQPRLPKDYINSYDAQYFLNYAEAEPSEVRTDNTIYTKNIDGKEAKRAIYTANSWHTLTFFNPNANAKVIDWFEDTIGAPKPIESSNQVFIYKMLFNLIGLVGFFLFVATFAMSLLFTPVFSSLRTAEVVAPRESLPGDKKWFWILLVLCPLFGCGIYTTLMNKINARTWFRDPWAQPDTWGIGVWTMVIALFTLALMALIYLVQWRKQGVSLKERGLTISLKNLGKTIVLAVLTVAAAYTCVFAGKFFFHADFRCYEIVRIVPFKASKLPVILWPYLPLFLTGYVASSIANNCFNYKVAGKNGKGQWKNLALCAVMSALPAILLYIPAYTYLQATGGAQLFPNGNDFIFVSWLISTLVMMPVSTVIGRKLYEITNNPYLGGIICGILMTMMKCMSTLTWA